MVYYYQQLENQNLSVYSVCAQKFKRKFYTSFNIYICPAFVQVMYFCGSKGGERTQFSPPRHNLSSKGKVNLNHQAVTFEND